MSTNQHLHDQLATFRRQATDIMTTINSICAMLQIDAHGSHSKRIGLIQRIVADHFEINLTAMLSRIRTQRFVVPATLPFSCPEN